MSWLVMCLLIVAVISVIYGYLGLYYSMTLKSVFALTEIDHWVTIKSEP